MKCVKYDLYSINANLINDSDARVWGWKSTE